MNIKWIGGAALLGAAAIVTLLATANAAVGDPVYVKAEDEVSLSGAQNSCLATAVSSIWPGSVPGNMTSLNCFREDTGAFCRVNENKTDSAANAVQSQSAGNLPNPQSFDGTNVTYTQRMNASLTSAQKASIVGCIELIWPSVSSPNMQEFSVRRPAGTSFAVLTHITTATPADYWTDWFDGRVSELVGILE